MLKNALFSSRTALRVAPRSAQARRFRAAIVLGSLREDVLWLPRVGLTEYPSFRHFGGRGLPRGYLPFAWPGPTRTADVLYRRALRRARRGELAAAFVALGRIVHVVTDVCIPSHVHRAAHERDPFEWHVEGNVEQLRALPVPRVAPARRASELVTTLAREAARFRPDPTSTPLGRVLARVGLARRVDAREAREQPRRCFRSR